MFKVRAEFSKIFITETATPNTFLSPVFMRVPHIICIIEIALVILALFGLKRELFYQIYIPVSVMKMNNAFIK